MITHRPVSVNLPGLSLHWFSLQVVLLLSTTGISAILPQVFYNESKLANPQHTFSKPGTFVVSLQATDINNCSTTTYKTITVDALPEAAFSYKGGACDSLVTFKNMTTGAAIASWTWEFGDGNTETIDAPASPDVNHYYPYPGVYQVTLDHPKCGRLQRYHHPNHTQNALYLS